MHCMIELVPAHQLLYLPASDSRGGYYIYMCLQSTLCVVCICICVRCVFVFGMHHPPLHAGKEKNATNHFVIFK